MNSNAPGQLLGYALQFPRALFHLLQCGPGESVCVEVLGDVARITLDSVTAEEDKSSVSSNPVTNTSINLWKTFSNWIDALQAKELDEKTKFILYVNKPAKNGIVNKFSDATTEPTVESAISFANEKLKKINDTHEIWPYYRNCMDNQNLLKRIIQNFELQHCEDGTGFSAVRKEIEKKYIAQSQIEFFLETMMGWLQKEIMTKIYAKQKAIISFEVFRAQISPLLERARQRELIDFTLKIAPTEMHLKAAAKLRPNYVRQLDKIGLPEDSILEAVSDFMRAKVNRDKWIEFELIDEDIAADFENRLHKFWKNQKEKNDIIYSGYTENDKGKLLLLDCKSRSESIKDMTPPVNTIAGTYHALADVPTLGWHSDWEADFKQ